MSRVTTKSDRPRRTSINGVRNVLSVKGKDPDYQYRIVNDEGDRINEFLEKGYEIVTDEGVVVGDKRVAKPTQTGTAVEMSVGNGTKAFLMRIKKDWYEEDQAAKQRNVDQIEQQIRNEPKKEGNYGNITIG